MLAAFWTWNRKSDSAATDVVRLHCAQPYSPPATSNPQGETNGCCAREEPTNLRRSDTQNSFLFTTVDITFMSPVRNLRSTSTFNACGYCSVPENVALMP